MGVLDDAIREHLDLKRRRGADPAEIERAEREALGPVRRGPEPQDAPDARAESALLYDDEQPLPYPDDSGVPYDDEDALRYDDDEEPDWEDAFAEEPRHLEGNEFDEPSARDSEFTARPGLATPPDDQRPSAPDQPTQHMSIPDSEFDDEFEEPRGAATARPHPAAPPLGAPDGPSRGRLEASGDETVQHDVEGAHGGEPGADKEDVLEETPEFLQDTPDHDRLWFEQKPPRDFDFDG